MLSIALGVGASTLGLPGQIGATEASAPVLEATVGVRRLPDPAPRVSRLVRESETYVDVDLPIRANLVAVSFAPGEGEDATVEVRARAGGTWSRWQALPIDPDEAPEGAEARRASRRTTTQPLWVGTADGMHVRVHPAPGEDLPAGTRVHVINSKGDAKPRNVLQRAAGAVLAFLGGGPSREAVAHPAQPNIISRNEWDANESWRTPGPGIASTLKAAFVHHTVNSNSYSKSESDDLVRAIYRYHTRTRGFSDIAYNFLISRHGQIFEGRAGGITKAVIGGHTMGFNTSTTGIALIGTFATARPPSAAITALKKLLAWKLDVHHVPPTGKVTLVAGGNAKYDPGDRVSFNRISGHRDAQLTSCPGARTYDLLPSIRSSVNAMGHPKIYLPAISSSVLRPDGDGVSDVVRLTARFSREVDWTVTFRNRLGSSVRRFTGTGTSLSRLWSGKTGSGTLVATGVYSWTIAAKDASSGHAARSATGGGLSVVTRHPDGTFLASDDERVWIAPGGTTQDSSGLALRSNYPPGKAVATGPSEIPRYPDDLSDLGVREGALLEKEDGTFLVFTGGVLRALTADARDALYTDGARAAALGVTDGDLDPLTQGPDYSLDSAHPDGTLVHDEDETSYWVIDDGTRHPIFFVSRSSRYRSGEAVPATEADLALPAAPAPIQIRDGALLRDPAGVFWMVQGGERRKFASGALYSAMGYRSSWAISVTWTKLNAIPADEDQPAIG